MQDKIREIRAQLRLAMNGIISTSMREKGLNYKLNFGVPFLELKLIAERYEKEKELADALWKEDVRELKILATMLQPSDNFPIEQAKEWIAEITNIEIAEYGCRNLFCKLPYADILAIETMYDRTNAYARTIAFQILAGVYADGRELSPAISTLLLGEAQYTMAQGVSQEQRAALLALKRFGRRSDQAAQFVLDSLSGYPASGSPELQEFYNDLKFEFEYYH